MDDDRLANAIERLRFAVGALPAILTHISEQESEQRPAPDRWSKKQVIGHLIDSASNNHQRFVRAQIAGGQEFPRYEQEAWVRLQSYQSAHWPDLIDLWRAYNSHLLHVVQNIAPASFATTCRLEGAGDVTLGWLVVDYVDHLEHHLRKALGQWP